MAPRDKKRDCTVCKKQRDDIHRANARIAGKDAERKRRWWAKRWADPEFHEQQLQRLRERNARPDYRLHRRLGIPMETARDMLEVRR